MRVTQGVQFAGTQQLAALGPTAVIFNFASYVFNALGIGTTTTVSAQLAKGDREGACHTASTALLYALICGFGMLLGMQVRACFLGVHLQQRALILPDAACCLVHA